MGTFSKNHRNKNSVSRLITDLPSISHFVRVSPMLFSGISAADFSFVSSMSFLNLSPSTFMTSFSDTRACFAFLFLKEDLSVVSSSTSCLCRPGI